MNDEEDLAVLRTRDFWSAIALLLGSIFFLWKTSSIPLFGENRAGVSGADWYNSAALVPLGIFGGMFILAACLLIISIRAGGASTALSKVGIGWSGPEALRFTTIIVVLAGYIIGLVPRVDFILCSALLITALIFGYRGGHAPRMVLAAISVSIPACFAFFVNLPREKWNATNDDWLTLAVWAVFTLFVLTQSKNDRTTKLIPVLSVLAPTILVCAMAFGFRQNVPNRGGLIFSQIEYQYYVTIKPLWSR